MRTASSLNSCEYGFFRANDVPSRRCPKGGWGTCPELLRHLSPPGGARSWVWSNALGCPVLGVVQPPGVPGPCAVAVLPRGCVQALSGNRRGPVTTEAVAMGRSERSERDSLPPSGGALLSRRSATGGAVPSGESGVRSAASWLTRCASCAPLPQPTPSGCPSPGVVQPPGGARSWVWSNPLGCPVLGVVQPPGVPGPCAVAVLPRRCVQVPSGNRRGPATTEAAAMGRSERSERDSLPPSGGAPFRLLGHRWPSPASRRTAFSTLPSTI